MKQVKGNILSDEILNQADAICFTSNGVIKTDSRLVMGAGVAKVFRDRFTNLDRYAGDWVSLNGNICQVVSLEHGIPIVAFPTKHHWKNPSDLMLIWRSAVQLKQLADKHGWQKIYLPRPGCNNGQLKWREVKSVLEDVLDDDRFIIITL